MNATARARDAEAGRLFMEDLAARLAHRVQLTTDGYRAYLSAVEGAFGWNGVDYAQLVKLYGPAIEGTTRYSPRSSSASKSSGL